MESSKRKGRGNRAAGRRVRFVIEAQGADQVALAGDFNAWDQTCLCLKKNGRWEKTMTLAPGTYEYKFLIDGQWRLDPGNAQVCLNCFGTRNNILEVEARSLPPRSG